MPELLDLWLPILLAAVFVFIASSVIHMATPMHKGDYSKLPDEEPLLEALRAHGVRQGTYMFPCPASMQEAGTPEFGEKMKRGPVGFMTVLKSEPMNMGKSLGQWFVFSILVGVFCAYLASLTMPIGADGRLVLRFTATIAFVGYGLANVTDSIWKGVPWGITAKFLVDGLIYAFVTGATFCWLWPAG